MRWLSSQRTSSTSFVGLGASEEEIIAVSSSRSRSRSANASRSRTSAASCARSSALMFSTSSGDSAVGEVWLSSRASVWSTAPARAALRGGGRRPAARARASCASWTGPPGGLLGPATPPADGALAPMNAAKSSGIGVVAYGLGDSVGAAAVCTFCCGTGRSCQRGFTWSAPRAGGGIGAACVGTVTEGAFLRPGDDSGIASMPLPPSRTNHSSFSHTITANLPYNLPHGPVSSSSHLSRGPPWVRLRHPLVQISTSLPYR